MQTEPGRLNTWPRGLALLCALGLALGASQGRAQESGDAASGGEVEARGESKSKAPWRGSFFSYRNALSLTSLDKGADLTWNPYWAMAFTLQPRWWFGDHLNVRANLELSLEVTNADDTTYYHEPVLGDFTLSVGWARFYTVPVLGIDLSADFNLVTPTSKISQARTLVLGLAPSLRLSRSFEVLGGLTLGYSLRVTGNLHRYTTAQTETSRIPGSSNPEYVNQGLRNARAAITQTGDVSLGILDWLSVSVAAGGVISFLYPLSDTPLELSQDTDQGVDRRWATLVDLSVAFQALPSLGISLGYSTVSPQLAPDSSRYNPIYNKYSMLYLDMRLDLDGLVKQITQADGED
jgi:hypothetical protein